MVQLADFDDIRPYSNDEVQTAIKELLDDRQFKTVVKGLVPYLPYWLTRTIIQLFLIGVKSTQDFQARVMQPTAKIILRRSTDGYTYHPSPDITWDKRYTFISNHRDIILDISIFNIMLYEHGAPTTCEVAIGDNLLIYPWIKKLVRLNKAFIVHRSLPPKEMFQSSVLMSQYMHFAINEKQENLWIAQREGRAKDSSDNTQEGVLKMMTLGYDDHPINAIRDMNVVPMTISYEFDPCDFLKAQEFQLKRDNANYKKTRQDDLINMRTGIFGYKGHVTCRVSKCINNWLDDLQKLPQQEFFRETTSRIDQQIHSHYELYPNNYIALDLLNGTHENADFYTSKEKQRFEKYIASQLDKIQIINRDTAFLTERMLTMYANPLKNYRASKNNKH